MTELNIVDVIGRRVELEVHGNGLYLGLCPFHKDEHHSQESSHFRVQTPTMLVFRGEEKFHCLKCKESGDAKDFLKKFED